MEKQTTHSSFITLVIGYCKERKKTKTFTQDWDSNSHFLLRSNKEEKVRERKREVRDREVEGRMEPSTLR